VTAQDGIAPGPTVASNDARWWLPEYKTDRFTRILAVVARIRARQVHWRKRDLLHAHLYRNLPILGFGPHQYGLLEPDDGRLTMNLVKAKVDTYVSMICRSKPKPMFLTSEGEWSMKQRAKGLDRWCEGKFYELDFYDAVHPLVVLDTGVFDFGVTKTFIDGARGDDWSEADVCIERAFPWEIVVDDTEALSGAPRNIYHRKWMDRGVLEWMYPAKRSQIADSPRDYDNDDWGRDDTSDQVLVTEAYHLPSGTGNKDGRRCVVIGSATLLDEPWEYDRFPFAFLQRSPPPHGIRGTSIAQELRPLQIAINQAMIDMQDSLSMFSRPKWMVNRNARVEQAHIDDDIGTIIEFDGPMPPQAYVPGAVSPDLVQYVNGLWERADELIGISAFRSAGIVPNTLHSGKAIELHNDVQDGRFLVASRQSERHVLRVTDHMIDLARIISERNPKYTARFQRKTYVQMVQFRDVDMKRDEYVMKVYPTSALAQTPSARLDQLQDMLDRGIIDLDAFRQLLDFPDLEGETSRLNSGRELAEKLIERYLDAEDTEAEGLYLAPEPSWPLAVMRSMMQMASVKAELEGAPEANVALMRRFVAQCIQTINEATPPPAPPAAGAPPGPPMMMPPGAAAPPAPPTPAAA
jgi:hypothetical protein